jgi:fatty acid desaturase
MGNGVVESRTEERAANGRGVRATNARTFGREARELTAPSRGLVAYNLAYLSLAWIVAGGAIAFFWAYRSWLAFAIAFAVVSSRQQALLNCEHEAVHRKFLPRRKWNERVGRWLCAAPVGSPFGAARSRHLSHHELLGSPEDPDRELHANESQQTRRGLISYFVKGLLGGYAGVVLMGPRAPRDAAGTDSARSDFIALVAVQGAIAATLTLLFAWWVYPALWLAPLASVTALCHLIRSFVEHAITEAETTEHSNRLITIRSNLLERGLVAPYFMNYHAEHHLLPAVPAPRLKRLQRRIAARDDAPPLLVRSSYGGAIRHYARDLPDD